MKFFKDLKRYYKYIIRSGKAIRMSEVAGSYLSWAWWILDPLFFMLVYVFIAEVVFNSKVENFPVFVFIGLTVWTFFDKNVVQSVQILKRNKGIVTKIYLQKQMLLLQNMYVNGFKMFISWLLVIVLMLFFRVRFTWYALYVIPHLLMLFIVTFAAGTILMHFGVFIQDLQNVVTVGLRLCFYMSGIFYDITKRVPFPYSSWLVIGNPVALAMNGCRNALLYQKSPNWKYLIIWTLIGLAVSAVGTKLVYKYENTYGKVL